MNFKAIVIFIKLLTSVVLLQTFGKLIHDPKLFNWYKVSEKILKKENNVTGLYT